MKKIQTLSLLIFVALGILGCKKDSTSQYFLRVGVPKAHIQITDFDPHVVIVPENQRGSYSLDLDKDEIEDIKISFHKNFSAGLLWTEDWLNIETLNSSTFILTDSVYPIAFQYGDTIKFNDNWNSGFFTLRFHGVHYYPTSSNIHLGYWNSTPNAYVAIKCNDCLSWVQIDAREDQNFGCYFFAVYQFGIHK